VSGTARVIRILALVAERAIWATLAAVLIATTAARAERPVITIGGGGITTPASSPVSNMSVLLRVGVDGVKRDLFGLHCTLAQIQGDLAVDPRSAADRRLPYLDIKFTAIDCPLGDGVSGGKFKVLPVNVGSSMRLDQNLRLRIDAIGYEKNYMQPIQFRDDTVIFAKLAADAIGYKMVSHLSEIGSFHGFNLGSVNVEVGAILATDHVTVRIVFGGNADVSFGGNIGGGFAIQSDLEAYSEITADVSRYLRFFIRNSLLKSYNSGSDDPAEYQLLTGAMFIF
jgi:hypothetical protein